MEDFKESAAAFGRFQQQLSDFPAAELSETIPHFHDTPRRYTALREAIRQDVMGRAAGAWDEINFVLAREQDAALLMDKLRAPFKGVCAHAWVLEGGEAAAIVRALRDAPPEAGLEPALAARLDALAEAGLDEASLCPERFTPLPVLGVPGWWPGNADPAFYDDVRVFRPGRARRAGGRAPQPAPRRQPDSQRAGP